MTLTSASLILAARDLRSDGMNREYDRALVEFVGYAAGVLTSETDHVVRAAVLHDDDAAAWLIASGASVKTLADFPGPDVDAAAYAHDVERFGPQHDDVTDPPAQPCQVCGETIEPDDGGAIWYHADGPGAGAMSVMCDGDDSVDLTRQATPRPHHDDVTDPIAADVLDVAHHAAVESLAASGEHAESWTSADVAADVVTALARLYGIDLAAIAAIIEDAR